MFTIPREMTLSTRTSQLPGLLGTVEWKRFKLDEGWAGLILCMLWEEAQGPLSKWAEYLGEYHSSDASSDADHVGAAILPTAFDTPMFWSEEELEELKGTSVVGRYNQLNRRPGFHPQLSLPDKIGKDDAERDFHEKVMPTVQVRLGSRLRTSSYSVATHRVARSSSP